MSDERLDDDIAHSPLGPSAANGWATCADYVNANRGLPDEPSFPAAEGTVAHHFSDICLSLGFNAIDFVGQVTQLHEWEFVWTDEDASLLQHGLDRWLARPHQERFTERRVNIEPWTIPGQFGTLDRAGFDDEWIEIEDLKWGRWPVYPERNLQLVLYALGFWNDIARHRTSATKFRLSIDQPRCAGGGGLWETTLADLQDIGAWLRERAAATQAQNPPRVASELGCVWCRRKLPQNGGCATYEAFNLDALGMSPAELDQELVLGNDLPLTVPSLITPERRSFILSHRKMLETWLDQLAAQELEDYLAGLPTPGRKAVTDTQKGRRDAWTSEAEAAAVLTPLLGEKSFTKKLITPAQARKQVPETDRPKLAPVINPGESGKSMVPLADARPPIAVVLFEEESETGEIEK